MADANAPSAIDLLSVKSRVSWGAIAAGAMVALAIYVVLNLLGVALGIEVAVRGADVDLQAGAAIYAIVVLLLAMFFGGWATSRLAVGESKLEAVLYGIILWGLLFAGLIWLFYSGVRTGYGALLGLTTGAYSEGELRSGDVEAMIRKLGYDEDQARQVRDAYEDVKQDPTETVRRAAMTPAARQAAWWTLGGVVVSLVTVIVGSLVGSGELLQPVPILGVRRARRP